MAKVITKTQSEGLILIEFAGSNERKLEICFPRP